MTRRDRAEPALSPPCRSGKLMDMKRRRSQFTLFGLLAGTTAAACALGIGRVISPNVLVPTVILASMGAGPVMGIWYTLPFGHNKLLP